MDYTTFLEVEVNMRLSGIGKDESEGSGADHVQYEYIRNAGVGGPGKGQPGN
jgi:hypothetical protein